MESMEVFTGFIEATGADVRISIAHIGLYATLFQKWSKQGFVGPIEIYSYDIMLDAKISSCATYHKLIRDLDAFGYLHYQPSFYKRKASKIYLDEINKEKNNTSGLKNRGYGSCDKGRPEGI